MNLIQRAGLAYQTVGSTFGEWLSPIATAALFGLLRLGVAAGMALDPLLYPRLARTRVERPIIIVGNPRTGTTFLQRFLVKHGVGTGFELLGMIAPSIALRRLLRPLVPLLERVSPARHHGTEAHRTSLSSVETDDVSVLFRYFDGFFLFGFVLAWAEQDYQRLFDPGVRDTSARDFDYLEAIWRRNLVHHGGRRVVAKLFSLGPRLPAFLNRYPDARILYMVRDPLDVIPSAMSLVTGVLDKRFGFWAQPAALRARYLGRLYGALVELMRRFTDDYTGGRVPSENLMIVRYDRMMSDFEGLMGELLDFVEHQPSAALREVIAARGEAQRAYVSKHKYDLDKFGLDADAVVRDCAFFYDAFELPRPDFGSEVASSA
jgi:hypothetical protein